ncbi:MAG: hypothetical protein A3E38_02215 [Candidatus Moranbacteria bacterium RIFCSPHIGHO2_12_FULL_54_9]|nr:MAG: hypothetical protein A2878_01985 [Candidatus Moranbacteria bacterium RIFCSPHIGHO2_01_FULL_54_31]OGI25275.1 MAG: hypothetical protein A3E38_02215 [Candidatus Moranbacteria bacterium RIFCSPHIGHO2_12_FULL_54_9]
MTVLPWLVVIAVMIVGWMMFRSAEKKIVSLISEADITAKKNEQLDQDNKFRVAQVIKQEAELKALKAEFKAKQAELEAMEQIATVDSLTGLQNRHGLETFLNRTADIIRRDSHDLGTDRRKAIHNAVVLFIDLDEFKAVNDTHGHDVGDELLCAFACLLLETFKRPSDLVCRWGGDEFCIILNKMTLDEAYKLVAILGENIDKLNEARTRKGLCVIKASTGLGGAFELRSEMPIEKIVDSFRAAIKQADGTMYEVKSALRGG